MLLEFRPENNEALEDMGFKFTPEKSYSPLYKLEVGQGGQVTGVFVDDNGVVCNVPVLCFRLVNRDAMFEQARRQDALDGRVLDLQESELSGRSNLSLPPPPRLLK